MSLLCQIEMNVLCVCVFFEGEKKTDIIVSIVFNVRASKECVAEKSFYSFLL